MKRIHMGLLAFAAAAGVGCGGAANAQSVIEDWGNIKTPPAPEVKSVTLDPKTTALLMLDFMNQNCAKRPRCVASVPAVKKLLTEARAKGMSVVYTIIANTTPADIMTDVAPAAGEPFVQSGVDKFLRTDLEKILKDKGIQTVITVGTAAHGAVLYTASGATLRGIKAVVPVDGVSADNPYPEQYTAWHLANAPVVSPHVTLTKLNMIKF